ncbi:potassium transporter 5 [Amborella trichopoda]|uniref:Potassium transporter n=1 Tax=Amborella trichopoda TaxID=13333 RepID=W1PGI6_AMBTC|nr:potassium transporter 5 [Amborella trichopoda]ERN06736.1 hypothetical protein AMTR_s00005p00064010 [Amborella trichopoda]|eukprot:XP_006845061.1 potassium transporter 5 [Amborella trichopoda]
MEVGAHQTVVTVEMAENNEVVVSESQMQIESKSSSTGLRREGFKRLDSLDKEANNLSGLSVSKALSIMGVLKLAFQSIGVVYGDIGTSPLYVFESTFAEARSPPTREHIVGALSLIIYSLTLFPLIKYIFIVLWANDNGDGGTFAMYSLICRYCRVSATTNEQAEDITAYKEGHKKRMNGRAKRIKEAIEGSGFAKLLLLCIALFGTCMVIGDGILTPCISVLSAVEGVKKMDASISQEAVVTLSVAILVVLFSVQRLGSDKVGYTFAPAILVWYSFITVIGVYNILHHDFTVLKAFNPLCILQYFTSASSNPKQAWISLGGIVLCMTGTEAMFADLGHFSVRSIQIAFAGLVYPCLICAYVGQAAYLSHRPDHIGDAFYKSTPDSVYWPMFVVAVLASIIASQAMISATFAIIKQSMALGCFPRVRIVHTSRSHEGQVYIPEINFLLMLACVMVTASFKDTANIGNAYGIAVVAVMLVTTALLTLIMLMVWQTSLILVALFVAIFGSLELIYFSSVLYKFDKGGYLPLSFAAALFLVMYVWYYVQTKRYAYEFEHKLSAEQMTTNPGLTRVPGIGLLYTELTHGVPSIFSHFLTNLPAMHSVVVLVSVKYLPINKVPVSERFLFRRVGPKACNMYRCIARYGYRDRRVGNQEFERFLMDHLKAFIRTEGWEKADIDGQVSERNEVEVSIGELAIDHVVPKTQCGNTQSTEGGEDNCEERSNEIIREEDAEEEIRFLERSRESGVVYLLGHSEVRASKESGLVKKMVVDYVYDFLRRNSRQGLVALQIPHKNLLQVGMNYYI